MATAFDVPLVRVPLERWSAADVDRALVDRPLLLLLQRVPRPKSAVRRRIIILVHGLGSSGATWMTFLGGAFPAAAFEAFDFALFSYQTSLFSRLMPFRRRTSVEDWARVLANGIRTTIVEQERYDAFVLVAHSMGGLVSKFAIRHLIENDRRTALRLHSLFTYGTPNHGSDRANAIGALLSPDLAFLREYSEPIRDLLLFWTAHISAVPEVEGKLTVHERALVSITDYWVSQTSGIASLPPQYVHRIASPHQDLIRPTSADDQRLDWFVQQFQAIQRYSECELVDIRNPPDMTSLVGDAMQFAKKLFEAIFVLDVGTADGVAVGDWFGLYYESTEVTDAQGRVIDRIPGAMNLLIAIEVSERAVYCKLESFAYEQAFDQLGRAVDQLKASGVDEIDEAQGKALIVSLFGRRAARIARRESVASKTVEDAYSAVLERERGTPERAEALETLLASSRAFLDDHPGSVLADRAAFHEAWATMELGRGAEARQLFEQFAERYPFSTSVSGARRWIEEIGWRAAVRDSGGGADQQLRLAEYLLENDRDAEEAASLAFAAYVQKPELLPRMKPGVRFMLAAGCVFHQILKQELDSPEAMGAELTKYRTDDAARQQVRSAVEGAADPARATLLLALVDAASSDWQKQEQANAARPPQPEGV